MKYFEAISQGWSDFKKGARKFFTRQGQKHFWSEFGWTGARMGSYVAYLATFRAINYCDYLHIRHCRQVVFNLIEEFGSATDEEKRKCPDGYREELEEEFKQLGEDLKTISNLPSSHEFSRHSAQRIVVESKGGKIRNLQECNLPIIVLTIVSGPLLIKYWVDAYSTSSARIEMYGDNPEDESYGNYLRFKPLIDLLIPSYKTVQTLSGAFARYVQKNLSSVVHYWVIGAGVWYGLGEFKAHVDNHNQNRWAKENRIKFLLPGGLEAGEGRVLHARSSRADSAWFITPSGRPYYPRFGMVAFLYGVDLLNSFIQDVNSSIENSYPAIPGISSLRPKSSWINQSPAPSQCTLLINANNKVFDCNTLTMSSVLQVVGDALAEKGSQYLGKFCVLVGLGVLGYFTSRPRYYDDEGVMVRGEGYMQLPGGESDDNQPEVKSVVVRRQSSTDQCQIRTLSDYEISLVVEAMEKIPALKGERDSYTAIPSLADDFRRLRGPEVKGAKQSAIRVQRRNDGSRIGALPNAAGLFFDLNNAVRQRASQNVGASTSAASSSSDSSEYSDTVLAPPHSLFPSSSRQNRSERDSSRGVSINVLTDVASSSSLSSSSSSSASSEPRRDTPSSTLATLNPSSL